MPIPILFIGLGAGAAALGIGKSVKAGVDQKEANRTNETANSIIKSASSKIEEYRKNCGNAIDDLGKCKIQILDESIKPFIEEFEKLNHIEFMESNGLNELQKMVLDKKKFVELKDLQNMASSMLGGFRNTCRCCDSFWRIWSSQCFGNRINWNSNCQFKWCCSN